MARDLGPGMAVLTSGPAGSPATKADDRYLALLANRTFAGL
jgi:hypothetical protein